ncbi:hypothetical protein KGF56_003440 [Candida oxycetoniae]|uniref:Zn(2)-C6 fungal-type domain-containing protein n=1 Tax=Candida oxycetoniae TaxID=497107 RepID=A0AAI9WXI4_9ASCO|nr:uncharacterized protein KGF56_003440 [Candida oxycetoniae]KAI3403805.2 hypothetical protein KGF56_003440 [Candida oxycetoniae]
MSFITKATKAKRASVACNTCRESKLKCLNNSDLSSCQRCKSLKIKCTYTLKTSQYKRRTLRQKQKVNVPPPPPPFQKVKLPDKNLIIEVVMIFFENQYKGIFPIFHKPSFVSFLRSDLFDPNTFIDIPPPNLTPLQPDPVTLLAVLALCSRLHPELPKLYGTFSESSAHVFQPTYNHVPGTDSASNASNYFGWHARRLLSDRFDNPSLSRIQALCVLSSHEWGEGNAFRSYMYCGIAARMAMVLGLDEEEEEEEEEENGKEDGEKKEANKENDLQSIHFLEKEIRRRVMWSVYMMDRCNASGRRSRSCLSLKDIHIRLPCDEKSFIFGTGVEQCFRDDVGRFIKERDVRRLSQVSCCGFKLYLFESWRNISKWVGETGAKLELMAPWDEKSPYYQYSKELDLFEENLPKDLKFDALDAHIANGSAIDFAYFHGLFFLSRIFLCREYFYSSPDSLPPNWWKEQATKLFDSLDKLDLITKSLKPINLMVIAPFTGFQVFTTGATSLYIAVYPSKILKMYFGGDVSRKYLKMAESSLETLKSWSASWGLGKKWIETLKKLKEMFAKVSDVQDDELRHKMHDYGNIEPRVKAAKETTTGSETLDFMNNLNLGNIFPDWSDAMNVQ